MACIELQSSLHEKLRDGIEDFTYTSRKEPSNLFPLLIQYQHFH